MDLLERSSALSELGGLLAAAAAGGRVVLVAGEAGIGKSALVRGFAGRHGGDARFLVGGCDPLLTPRALGPLHDIARQTGGRLAELLATGGGRLRRVPGRAGAAAAAAGGGGGGGGCALGRRGDPGSAGVPGRRLERTRALLIVIYRDDELGADHPLPGVLGALPPGVVQRVRLGPLSGAAVAELARRAGRPAAVLQQVTGGNPLLVSEVLAAGEPGVRTRTRTRRWLASP